MFARRPRVALLTLLLIAVAMLGLGGCASPEQVGRSADEPFSFWPPPPDEPRVQFLRSFRVSSDVEPEQSALSRMVLGDEAFELPISKPYGVGAWNGRLYVCDISNSGVVILDLVRKQTRVMVARGVEQMAQPTDIAIADDGMKYVVDRRLGRIFVFNADDRHVTTFGERGLVPASAAVHGNELFVSDFETKSILVLDRFRGNLLRSIGAPGGGAGQFVRPLGVATGPGGELYVADAIRGCMQRFDADGTLDLTIGEISDVPGNFVRPKHVATDRDGIVYVVDAAFQNVQMFDSEGRLLMYFGGGGGFPGAMDLPAGVDVWEGDLARFEEYVHPAFEASRLLVVTNQFGPNKVAVYALGQLRPGRTVAEIMPYAADLRPPETTPPTQPLSDEAVPAEADVSAE